MLLKKNVVLASLFSFFLFVGCTSEEPYTFSIQGKITNLDNTFIVLSKVEDVQKKLTTTIDTILIAENGTFKSFYNLPPNIYQLKVDSKKIPLAIDKNQDLIISGESSKNITVEGSVDTQLLMDYEVFRKASLKRLVTSVRTKVKELKKQGDNETEIAALRQLEVENYDKHLDELVGFVKEKMGTSIAIYPTAMRWTGNKNIPFLQTLVADFEKTHPNSELSKKIKNRLQILEKTSIGGVVSAVKMPNAEGTIIDLNTVKSNYTLIDVWASWCPPCRSESKLLTKLYKKYKSVGLEIYGVSLDTKREKWLKAVESDARIWTNVSTSQGFKTPFALEYGINALPTNYLIDASGKIIAVNVHGTALEEKITELFD